MVLCVSVVGRNALEMALNEVVSQSDCARLRTESVPQCFLGSNSFGV